MLHFRIFKTCTEEEKNKNKTKTKTQNVNNSFVSRGNSFIHSNIIPWMAAEDERLRVYMLSLIQVRETLNLPCELLIARFFTLHIPAN